MEVRVKGRKKRHLVAVFGAACLIGLIPGSALAGTHQQMPDRSPAPSQGIPDGMSALTYHRMLAQIPLDNAAARIRQAAARPGTGHDGLVEVWVNDDRHEVTVYWHGPVPADITSLLSALRRELRIGISITAAPYSSAELQQAVSQVMHSSYRSRVAVAGPLPDGSGIEVGVSGAAPVSGASPAADARRLFGVNVPVHVWTGATSHNDSRNDDQPQFWGGAVLNTTDDCSTGFGVHSTVDSRVYMLTAAHCGSIGQTFTNGTGSQTLGKMTHNSVAHDAAMIETNSGNAYYDGPGIDQGDTGNSKVVAGQQPSAVGDFLCESGAVGGVKCGLQIACLNQQIGSDVNVAFASPISGNRCNPGSTSDSSFPVGGDSGGPVFSLTANNKVIAKGIIKGEAIAYGSQFMAFNTIDWISHDFLVTVNTG
jgi:hypothetical protein